MTGVRRILLWIMVTVTVVVLLFGYRTSTSSQMGGTSLAAPGRQGSGFSATAPSASSPSSGGTSGGTSSGGGSGAAATAKTVTGPTVDTRWGPIQVAITVSGGKVTRVSVPVYPDGSGTDQQINSYALPILVQETLDAQSANIDMVSGATVTSDGYLRSLQAALDSAGI